LVYWCNQFTAPLMSGATQFEHKIISKPLLLTLLSKKKVAYYCSGTLYKRETQACG